MSELDETFARQRRIHREFARAAQRLMELRFATRKSHPDAADHLAELLARVEQMAFAFRHYARLEREYDRKSRGTRSDVIRRRTAAIVDAIPFYVEAFYYFAHRAMKLSKHTGPLGQLNATGIRDVRNHLIEHPLSMNRNFVFGVPEGFRLKPFRATGSKAPRDPGLHLNVEEFLQSLHGKLDAAGIRTCLP